MKAYNVAKMKTILLVDNEEKHRVFLKMLFNVKGYDVVTALDAKQAVEMYKANADNIDVVVLDVIKQNMNLIEAAEEIKQFNTNAEIVVTSGQYRDSYEVPHFIGKSVHPSGLFKFVKEILGEPAASFI